MIEISLCPKCGMKAYLKKINGGYVADVKGFKCSNCQKEFDIVEHKTK